MEQGFFSVTTPRAAGSGSRHFMATLQLLAASRLRGCAITWRRFDP
jgi:hypothetical protein